MARRWMIAFILLVSTAGTRAAEPPPAAAPPAAKPTLPVPAAPMVCEECPDLCICEGSCRGPFFSVQGEYLLWWVQRNPSPALITTGPAGSLGALNAAGTQVLFGNGLDYNAFSGFRGTLNILPDQDSLLGLQLGGFVLEQRSARFDAASDAGGSPLLARPVLNARTGQETSLQISAPDGFTGNVSAASDFQMWGLEANVFANLAESDRGYARLLAGARYINFEEDLNVRQNSQLLAGGIAGFRGVTLVPGETVSVADHFGARNQFIGGQIGGQVGWEYRRLGLDLTGKVGLGSTHQEVDLQGVTGRGRTGAVSPGGLLVVASNAGRFTSDEFTVLPELGVQFSYRVTCRLRAAMGYTLLYWSDVVRAGDQVSRGVNPSLVPASVEFGRGGAPAPLPPFRQTDFWAQGLSFGLEYRY